MAFLQQKTNQEERTPDVNLASRLQAAMKPNNPSFSGKIFRFSDKIVTLSDADAS
jgi:hypothetical protein